MHSKVPAMRIGAVVLAVALTGSYVWFRVSQSRNRAAAAASPVNRTATAPASAPPTMMPGSKFSRVYQHPYPDGNAIGAGFKLNNSISAEFAVASDMTPGLVGDDDNVLAVTSTSSAQQMKRGNSNNHDGDGQNVLYGDGHVEFQQNPFVGVQRDNVYTARTGKAPDPKSELVVASPYDANDSILLPPDD